MAAHSMDSHMNFRMSQHDKQIIETAARLKGLKPLRMQGKNCWKLLREI